MWRVACEDANSKLVEAVTVADVDDEKRFDDSFMLNFGRKAKFCSDFERKVWSRVWLLSWSEVLKLKFGQYFAAEACWG